MPAHGFIGIETQMTLATAPVIAAFRGENGIAEGEQVVTLGQAALRDGAKVQVINSEAPVAVASGG